MNRRLKQVDKIVTTTTHPPPANHKQTHTYRHTHTYIPVLPWTEKNNRTMGFFLKSDQAEKNQDRI